MNLVLDDAVEVHLKRHTRKPLTRIMLKEPVHFNKLQIWKEKKIKRDSWESFFITFSV